jgi:hypothetical protein
VHDQALVGWMRAGILRNFPSSDRILMARVEESSWLWIAPGVSRLLSMNNIISAGAC